MATPAPKQMTKGEIVDHLSKKLGTTKKLTNDFMVELNELAYKQAKKGFTIPGLGKVFTTRTKKRNGRNPATGAAIVIPAKNKVKFKVSKAAQDAVYPTK
jgi:DNA-binding protein HU-beta